MAESLQHKLDRVRRPRVQITYDVETNGAMQKVELPFVVGVMADLSGKPKEALKPLKDRKVVTIDRDNFNDVLAKATPRVAMKVDNKLTEGDTKLAVELNFKHLDDFEPAKVVEQVPALRELMDMRQKLVQLLSKMEGNDKLEELLGNVLSNTEKAMSLAKELGIETPKEGSTDSEGEPMSPAEQQNADSAASRIRGDGRRAVACSTRSYPPPSRRTTARRNGPRPISSSSWRVRSSRAR